MNSSWYIDPAIILEREDNRRSCPACQFNDFTRAKNGYKKWYCVLNHNQKEGTQVAESCADWMRKRMRSYG